MCVVVVVVVGGGGKVLVDLVDATKHAVITEKATRQVTTRSFEGGRCCPCAAGFNLFVAMNKHRAERCRPYVVLPGKEEFVCLFESPHSNLLKQTKNNVIFTFF